MRFVPLLRGVFLLPSIVFGYTFLAMENKTITLDPELLKQEACLFGSLTKKTLGESLRLSGRVYPLETCLLFVATQFAAPLQIDQSRWLGALLSSMGVMAERKFALQVHGAIEDLVFPEWDPEDKEALPCYPLCDVYLNLKAWRLCAEEGFEHPKDCYGPLFSLAGYVLDGTMEGFSSRNSDMEKTVEEYFARLFPSDGAEGFLAQLDQLQGLYDDYKKENGIA